MRLAAAGAGAGGVKCCATLPSSRAVGCACGAPANGNWPQQLSVLGLFYSASNKAHNFNILNYVTLLCDWILCFKLLCPGTMQPMYEWMDDVKFNKTAICFCCSTSGHVIFEKLTFLFVIGRRFVVQLFLGKICRRFVQNHVFFFALLCYSLSSVCFFSLLLPQRRTNERKYVLHNNKFLQVN